MTDAKRVSAEEALRKVREGKAILVCGYDEEEKCARASVPGAMTMRAFQAQEASLPRDRELFFYCA